MPIDVATRAQKSHTIPLSFVFTRRLVTAAAHLFSFLLFVNCISLKKQERDHSKVILGAL